MADAIGYPFRLLVKLLMLTGARLDGVVGPRWREFDLPNKIGMIIGHSKKGLLACTINTNTWTRCARV